MKDSTHTLLQDISSIRSIIHLDLDSFYAQVEIVRLGMVIMTLLTLSTM